MEQLENRQFFATDLVADATGFKIKDTVSAGGYAYFVADDGIHGKELWRSNGKASGTQMVIDLNEGTPGSNLHLVGTSGNRAIFKSAVRSGNGTRHILYGTDGTDTGTKQIAGVFEQVAQAGNLVAFRPEAATRELWVTDGTKAGTKKLKTFDADRQIVRIVQAGSRALLGDAGGNVWSTDGNGAINLSAGDVPIESRLGAASFHLDQAVELNGSVVFSNGPYLMKSDGTVGGSTRSELPTVPNTTSQGVPYQLSRSTTDLFPVLDGSDPGVSRGVILQVEYTSRVVGTKTELWYSSDGTAGSAKRMFVMDGRGLGFSLAAYKDASGKVVVIHQVVNDASTGRTVYSFDPASGQVSTLASLPGELNTGAGNVTVTTAGGKMFFGVLGSDGVTSVWATDGTPAGTVAVTSLGRSTVFRLSEYGGKLVATNAAKGVSVVDPTTLTGTDPLEGQPVVTSHLTGDVLRVYGSTGNDSIKLYRQRDDASRLVVEVNGQVARVYSAKAVNRVQVYAGSGDDAIAVDERFQAFGKFLVVYGGGGGDSIRTTNGADRVFGEAGNDKIIANGGSDSVNGGVGNDSIYGGAGTDTLSGGGGGIDSFERDRRERDVVFGQRAYDIFFGGAALSSASRDDLVVLI